MKGLVIHWDPHEDYTYLVGGAKRWLSSFIFTMEMFGFDTLFVVGKPNIQHGYNIQHTEFDSLSDIFESYPDPHKVILTGEAPEGIDLYDLLNYTHSERDVLYIIGGDYTGLDWNMCEQYNPDYIKISGIVDNPNLWSFSVASILMYDYHIN